MQCFRGGDVVVLIKKVMDHPVGTIGVVRRGMRRQGAFDYEVQLRSEWGEFLMDYEMQLIGRID